MGSRPDSIEADQMGATDRVLARKPGQQGAGADIRPGGANAWRD